MMRHSILDNETFSFLEYGFGDIVYDVVEDVSISVDNERVSVKNQFDSPWTANSPKHTLTDGVFVLRQSGNLIRFFVSLAMVLWIIGRVKLNDILVNENHVLPLSGHVFLCEVQVLGDMDCE